MIEFFVVAYAEGAVEGVVEVVAYAEKVVEGVVEEL